MQKLDNRILKTSTKSAENHFCSLTMASEKMKEPEQFVKKHCIIRISSFFDSLLFPHCLEKGGTQFSSYGRKNICFGRQFLLNSRFDTEIQHTGSHPLRLQFNGQRFLEDRIQYKSESLIDTQTKHFESNHLLKLQPDLRLHRCQTVKTKNNLQQDQSSLTCQSSLKLAWT
jgi:hypothetical protein